MPNRSRTTKTAVAGATAAAVTVLGATASARAVPPDQPSPRTVKAGLTCMPKPSACGFPDATNTGVPPGTPLTRVDGSVTLSTPGQVYSGREVHGSIRVTASNVTIEKTRVIGSSDVPLIYPTSGATNTVIRDVEVDMAGQEEGKGIAFDNYTAQRVWFHNGLDCAHQGRNVTITDSFCDLPKLAPGSPAHADGFQSDGGGNYVFRHNTIRNPNGQTSAILMSTNTSPISNVVIDHNLMSGGGYTVYCGTDEGGIAPSTTYTNNVISREFFPNGGRWGPTTWCDRVATAGNNVWDGNYVPPPGTVPAPRGGGGNAPGTGKTAPRLKLARAKKFARAALSQALGREAVPRSKRVRVRCDRRSATRVGCGVAWRNARRGKTVQRYQGKVVLTKSGQAARYRMRIRVWERHCDCRHLVKRSGSL